MGKLATVVVLTTKPSTSIGGGSSLYAIATDLREDLVDKIIPNTEVNTDAYYAHSNFWMFYYLMRSDNDSLNSTFESSFKNTETSGSFCSGGFPAAVAEELAVFRDVIGY